MLAVPQAMTNTFCLGSESKKGLKKYTPYKDTISSARAIAFQRIQLLYHSRW